MSNFLDLFFIYFYHSIFKWLELNYIVVSFLKIFFSSYYDYFFIILLYILLLLIFFLFNSNKTKLFNSAMSMFRVLFVFLIWNAFVMPNHYLSCKKKIKKLDRQLSVCPQLVQEFLVAEANAIVAWKILLENNKRQWI